MLHHWCSCWQLQEWDEQQKTELHILKTKFCSVLCYNWMGDTQDGNLMHTSCWEDKQTQGAILLLGDGDPVGCAANGSYVAGLHLGVPFCFSGILCQYCLSSRPIPLGKGQWTLVDQRWKRRCCWKVAAVKLKMKRVKFVKWKLPLKFPERNRAL